MTIELKKQYRTRDGREVRIYAVDGSGDYSVHGAFLTEDGWTVNSWALNGMWRKNATNDIDLVEVRPRIKREFWVNVYPNGVNAFRSREQADDCANDFRIACVRVEIDVEEGHGL